MRKREENRRQTGTFYERKAGEYLEKQGYKILEYNYRCRAGEIDIVARDGEYLVFCEVKYRKDNKKGTPLEAVTLQKQRTALTGAAAHLLVIQKRRYRHVLRHTVGYGLHTGVHRREVVYPCAAQIFLFRTGIEGFFRRHGVQVGIQHLFLRKTLVQAFALRKQRQHVRLHVYGKIIVDVGVVMYRQRGYNYVEVADSKRALHLPFLLNEQSAGNFELSVHKGIHNAAAVPFGVQPRDHAGHSAVALYFEAGTVGVAFAHVENFVFPRFEGYKGAVVLRDEVALALPKLPFLSHFEGTKALFRKILRYVLRDVKRRVALFEKSEYIHFFSSAICKQIVPQCGRLSQLRPPC